MAARLQVRKPRPSQALPHFSQNRVLCLQQGKTLLIEVNEEEFTKEKDPVD